MTSLLTFFTSPSITHQLNVHVKAGFSEDSAHQDVIRAQSSFGNLIWKGWLGMLEQARDILEKSLAFTSPPLEGNWEQGS